MGKSNELSFDLTERIINLNKSGKSLGAFSKQLQVLRSTLQTPFYKYKVLSTVCVTAMIRKHKLSPAAERKLVRMVKSQPKNSKK